MMTLTRLDFCFFPFSWKQVFSLNVSANSGWYFCY